MGAACGLPSKHGITRSLSSVSNPPEPRSSVFPPTPDSHDDVVSKFCIPSLRDDPKRNSNSTGSLASSRQRPPPLEIPGTPTTPTTPPTVTSIDAERKKRIYTRDNELLRTACSDGDAAETKRVLDKYRRDTESLSADELVLDKLVINMKDSSGANPLINACTFGNLECLQLLVDSPGLDLSFCGKDGKSAVHRAAYNGHAHLLPVLAERGFSLDAVDKKGNTALHLAVANNLEECVTTLLSLGAQCNLYNCDRMTPLALALKKKSKSAIVDALKASGGVRSTRSSFSESPAVGEDRSGVASLPTEQQTINPTASISN